MFYHIWPCEGSHLAVTQLICWRLKGFNIISYFLNIIIFRTCRLFEEGYILALLAFDLVFIWASGEMMKVVFFLLHYSCREPHSTGHKRRRYEGPRAFKNRLFNLEVPINPSHAGAHVSAPLCENSHNNNIRMWIMCHTLGIIKSSCSLPLVWCLQCVVWLHRHADVRPRKLLTS